MSEKERNKAGLHKRISSIFNGVLIPQKEGEKKSSFASIPGDTDFAVPKQPAPESRESESPKPNQAEQILPEAESTQVSEAEPAQEPKAEPVQESKAEPVHAPKFVTAHESKVVPVEESEIESVKDSKSEPDQETKNKQASPPKFMTAQVSRVIPVEESDVESTQESEAETAQKPKNEPVHQDKFEKDKRPKVIPVKESKKTGIEKISKKVSKKRPVVKVSSESSWKQITDKLFARNADAGTTKQKATVAMVPVLFVVLLIFVFKGGIFGTSVHNAEAGEENNNPGVASAALNNQIDWEIPEPYPATLRDPTQLGSVVTGTNQNEPRELVKLIVKSILYSDDNPSAIIDNRIVHEGDQIQNASIIKISKVGVEFEVNGEKWTQKVQR
jgi:hypothetical protein